MTEAQACTCHTGFTGSLEEEHMLLPTSLLWAAQRPLTWLCRYNSDHHDQPPVSGNPAIPTGRLWASPPGTIPKASSFWKTRLGPTHQLLQVSGQWSREPWTGCPVLQASASPGPGMEPFSLAR